MKKNIFLGMILSLSLLIIAGDIHAGWYGAYNINKAANGARHCSPDGQADAVGPTPAQAGNGGTFGVQYPDGQTMADADLGAQIRCWKWDSTNPSVSATNASAVWKNADIPLTGNSSDGGGSALSISRYSINNVNCWAGTDYADGFSTSITAEGDYTLYLCGQDGAGNQGIWNGQYRLDKTKPVVLGNNIVAGWRNADINVTLSASDALSGLNPGTVKYVWDVAACNALGNVYVHNQVITLTNEGLHTLYLCGADNAGNQAVAWLGNYRLDKTKPTLSATSASATWVNANIGITLSVSDAGGSGLKAGTVKYRWDNLDCVGGGNAFVDNQPLTQNVEGDHVLFLCAEDNAGNLQTWNGQYRLDKTNPTLGADNTSALWRNANIPVQLSVGDPISGLVYAKYTINDANCTGNGLPFVNNQIITISTEGTNTLRLCAADNAGNLQTWSSNLYKLDKTNPILSATNDSLVWKNANIGITLSVSDAGGSSLNAATVKYRWDNSDCVGGGLVFANGTPLTLNTEGDHTLYLCAADNAGNLQTWSGVYRLDKTNPILSATNDSLVWKNANIGITLSVSDAGGSSLNAATVKYRWDNSDCVGGGLVFANGTPLTLNTEGDHTLYLCAADNAGNLQTWSGVYRLDKTNPIVSANANSATWKNINIGIQLFASDAAGGSALSNTRYIWHLNNFGVAPTVAACLAGGIPFNDTDIITLSTEGDHTLYLCVEDNATNQGTWNGIYRLDRTNPVVSATNSSLVWQAGPIPVTFNESDPIPYAGAIVSQTNIKKYYWDYLNTLGGGTVNFAHCMANGTNFFDGNNMGMNTPGDHTLYMCANDIATNNSALWTGIYRYDGTPPTASNLTYANAVTNGWTNNTTITVNWLASDTIPGSGLKNHDVRIYESNGNAQDPIIWSLINTVTTAGAAPIYTYVGTNGKAYKFEVLPRDNANNTPALWTTSPDTARIDTIAPNQNNLIMTTAMILLATGTQDFNYTFNDGGAPVALVGQMEDKNNPAGWVASFAGAPFSYTQSFTHDVSVVDVGGDRTADGNTARTYMHSITQITDQAGNPWNGVKNYTYNVYANPNHNLTIIGNNTAFTLGSVVADGAIKTWQAVVQDGFGNAIVAPAPAINRVMDYNLTNITNTMFLNQYTRSGPTSVYVIPPSGLESGLANVATQALGTHSSANGAYPLGVKVFTPTNNGHIAPDQVSDPNATFGFDINLTVSDTLIGAPKTVSHGSPAFRYEPLFRTVFNGELNDGGFIEGTEQASNIDVIKNALALPGLVSFEVVELTFSGAEATKFDFYADSSSPVGTAITNKTQFNTSPAYSAGTVIAHPFMSQLVQKPNAVVTNLSNLWLTSHMSYSLDGKNITTNSDSIGKDSFFGLSNSQSGSQVGVKIIGAVSSKYINNMIDGQFQSGTILMNYQSRSEVRNNIKKNIALAIRNASGSTIGTAITNLNSLPAGAGATGAVLDRGPKGSILYIEKTGGDVALSTGAVSGIKTIVVKGANLWIMQDMYYDANGQSILGVVVQKDENGNGGNLYVHPNVTNIVGAYILDGSIISYNGAELGYNTQTSILRNQLLIYGSIVSENSIGGSRATTPICPSMIGLGACTLEIAQTYDLNYLRRYYLVGNNPSAGSNVIGHGLCVAGVCGSFDNKLRKLFSNTSNELARYPIVIEYNPLIQRTPPIGFANVFGN